MNSFLFLLLAITALVHQTTQAATTVNGSVLGTLDLLHEDLLHEIFAKLNVFDKIRFKLTRKNQTLPWGPGELEFVNGLAEDEAALKPYQYFNENEHLLKILVPRLARQLDTTERRVRRAVQETNGVLRLTQEYGFQEHLLLENLNLMQDRIDQHVSDVGSLRKVYEEAREELSRDQIGRNLKTPYDDDWLMDAQLASTLTDVDHFSFLNNVRNAFSSVLSKMDDTRTPTNEFPPDEKLAGRKRYIKRMAPHILPEFRKPFDLMRKLGRLRRIIKHEKFKNPAQYDDDTRMTELLVDLLQLDPLHVQKSMKHARATVRYNLAVSQERPFAVCKYILLNVPREKRRQWALTGDNMEMIKLLAQYPFFTKEYQDWQSILAEAEVVGDGMAREDVDGEDMNGEATAGEDLAGEDVAGEFEEEMAGEDMNGEDVAREFEEEMDGEIGSNGR